MPGQKVKDFLDSRGVKYLTLQHSRAYTAQEIAARTHISGRDFAKTVIVFVNGAMAMVVLPAALRLHLAELRDMLGTLDVRLAEEKEFRQAFPDYELGAMPPFGNLYNLPVYVAGPLAEEPEIAFNAGTHTEVIQMAYDDFESLVHPEVMEFITA